MLPAAAIYGILAGAHLLGGIVSGLGGRKSISPDFLREHFGPQAVTEDTLNYFNRILNSPTGQNMIAQAAQRGGQVQNEIESRAAMSGMGGGGGGSSGASIFSQAAGGGAAQHATADVRSGIWENAFNAAQAGVAQRQNQWAGLYSGWAARTPTAAQAIGSSISDASDKAAAGLQQADFGRTTAKTTQPVQGPTVSGTGTSSDQQPLAGMVTPTMSSMPRLSSQSIMGGAGGMNPSAPPRSMSMIQRPGARINRLSGGSFGAIQPMYG